jgi:transposase
MARPQLPVEEEIQDLPEGAPCCPVCHQPYLEFFRTEDTDVIEVQVRAHIRRIKRKMYRRGCRCASSPALITAPLAPRLLARNPLGISVWTEVLLDKYLYARPTRRLLQQYASLGLPISQGTSTDGLKHLAPLFEPLIAAMHEKQMGASLFFGDETRWMVFEHETPQSLDEVQVRRIWWQENQLDARGFQVFLHRLRSIVGCVVTNDRYVGTFRMFGFDLLDQLQCRFAIDRVVHAHFGRHGRDVDRTVDVQTAPTGIGRQREVLATLDPAVSGDWIVLWVHPIGKIQGPPFPLFSLAFS